MMEQGTSSVLSQRSDAGVSSEAQASFIQRTRTQLTRAFIEHIYSTEDTLFKIAYDQKFRPKLYALCVKEPVDKDAARLYKALKQSYDENVYESSSSGSQSQLENRKLSSEQRQLSVFEQQNYLERTMQTRLGLLHKFPLMICLSLALL